MDKLKWDVEEVKGFFLLMVIVLSAVGFVFFLVYQFFTETLEDDVVRIWALVATLLVPTVGIVCFKLGMLESTGMVKGIEAGVGKVVPTAEKVAEVRVTAARAMREMGQGPVIELPPLQGHYQLKPPAETDDIVELS